MVKVFLKGGVWKNSEDEVLKAAVQKYGKQQWARVASLLNRKTAKQAKARWHEWLDPDIRKTEWSREEEEKLLHLAKLMPAQWKTIAPIVGRTATQCQEHYEYLLDQAAGGTSDELRQALRPGQIDAHPETKPARPDPIDMDEDEMEMLQEARARLANTQGKKAKRKQREKILAEAKRLADLQKRRELKQAGLLSKAALKKSKKSKKEIDLGVEIPFHKPAPAGFHDTAGEVSRTNALQEKRLKQVDFHKINENRYRSRDFEEAQRKKKEERRLKILEQANDKYKKQKEEVQPARARLALKLPAPAVSDTELAQLAKMQSQTDPALEQGSEATAALLGDYSDRPLPTPMRTPATTTTKDLAREASKLRMLERGQTPLLASQHAADDEAEEETTDTDLKVAAAPTPRLPDRAGVGRTPRDQFGLNRPATALRDGGDAASVGASTFASTKYSIRELAREERRAAKKARMELEAALAALPAPQFEYELAAPEDLEMEDVAVETAQDEMDQADLEAAERERKRKKAQQLYEAQSSVLKRKELPRPSKLPSNLPLDGTEAKELIQEELFRLLQHDAHAHPVLPADETGKKKKKRKQEALLEEVPPEVSLDPIPERALQLAKETIEAEFAEALNAKVNLVLNEDQAQSRDAALALIAAECESESRKGAKTMACYSDGWKDIKSDDEVVASLHREFEMLTEATDALRKRNDKQESKVAVKTGGYVKRSEKLTEEILESFAETQNARIEESVYLMLKKYEVQGGMSRLDGLKEEISRLKQAETPLQKQYGDLIVEKRRLVVKARAAESGQL